MISGKEKRRAMTIFNADDADDTMEWMDEYDGSDR